MPVLIRQLLVGTVYVKLQKSIYTRPSAIDLAQSGISTQMKNLK